MNQLERTFENKRLDFYGKWGIDLEPGRARDRRQRETYLMDTGGGGVPLMMIHGGGSQSSEWAPLAGRIAQDRRLILVDRPGCGLSHPLDYTDTDMNRSASRWLADLLGDLDVGEVDLIARSTGAFFALSYLLSRKSAHGVRRLVLAGAPTGVTRSVPYQQRLMAMPGLNRLLFAVGGEPSIRSVRQIYQTMFVERPSRLSDAYLEVMVAGTRLPQATTGWRTLLEEMVGVLELRDRYFIRDEVESIEVPTLFIWGEKDRIAPPKSGAELADRMERAELERIPEAGHFPWIDQPGRVARAVDRFLAEPAEQLGTGSPEATISQKRG